MPNLVFKISVGHIYSFSRKLMCIIILFYFSFDFILCKVLLRILKEDWGEDPGFWTHIISILTTQLEWLTLFISKLILYRHYVYHSIGMRVELILLLEFQMSIWMAGQASGRRVTYHPQHWEVWFLFATPCNYCICSTGKNLRPSPISSLLYNFLLQQSYLKSGKREGWDHDIRGSFSNPHFYYSLVSPLKKIGR